MNPRRILFAAICACTAMLGSAGGAAAKVTVKERTIYYSVSGRTGKEIYEQFGSKGPKVAGERLHKVATSTLEFAALNLKGGVKGKRCVITNADIRLTVTYRIPKWTGAARASPALRKAWEAFIAHIWRHEKRHAAIAREYAAEVERGIRAVSGDARNGCAGMAEAGKRFIIKSRAWHDRRQAAFDASWFGDGGQQFKHDKVLYLAR